MRCPSEVTVGMPKRVALLAAVCASSSGFAAGRQLLRRGGHVTSSPVRKPLADERSYEHVTLAENGLKVLAIEDPRAAKAGFAVAVEAGSFYDPADFPGLAHFCEHLLFLGTEKYPAEASFDQFMALHDGDNNAFTEQEHTVFYNEVNHAGFDEGLDRFAQFFIAPLFKQELVSRELEAVNSEHEKNKPDQGRRLWEILRKTARADSVVSRFYTGTTESLHHGDAKAVATLRKYHTDNYCAPRMNLVMISNLSTSEQLRLAHKHFDSVPRGHCLPTTDFGSEQAQGHQPLPFDSDHIGKYITMGTNSTPALWIMFPLPATVKKYKEAPTAFLSYMLGYAGKDSLKSKLKGRGLISGLSLQADETTSSTLLFVMFDLTPSGAEDDGVREVAGSTFAFLQQLSAMSDGEVSSIYDSLQKMSQVSFDYSEAPGSVMDAASDLAGSMSRFPAEDVLAASYGLIQRQDTGLVRELLDLLAKGPHGASMALATPRFAHGMGQNATDFEKYYGIQYRQEAIPQSWIQQWSAKHQELAMNAKPPPALKYVPTTLSVRNITAGRFPVMSEVSPASLNGSSSHGTLELWWKGQGVFVLPKAQVRMKLSVPQKQENDATHEILRRLHAEVARQVLEEPTEDFQDCGLNLAVESAGDSYGVEADGYDEHLDAVLVQALDGLLEPSFGAAEFERARQQVSDDLSDTTRKAPYELALDTISALTTDDVFTREELMSALKNVDETHLREYISSLRDGGLRAQMLVIGNVDKARAQDIAARVADHVIASPSKGSLVRGGSGRLLAADEARKSRVLMASQPVEARVRNPIPGDFNNAVVNVYQYGVPDVSERVRLMILGKMIANPVYDTLRTKKQLGYVVFGFMTDHNGVLELQVLVQGAKEAPDPVETDIEAVITQFASDLRNTTKEEFTKWKASVASGLHHKDRNMGQEADRYWAQIGNDGHCFERVDLATGYLESLSTVDDVVETFDDLRKANRKVSVKMFGASEDDSLLKAAKQVSPSALSSPMVLVGDAAVRQKLGSQGAHYFPDKVICQVSK